MEGGSMRELTPEARCRGPAIMMDVQGGSGQHGRIPGQAQDKEQELDMDVTQLQSLLNQEFLTGPPGDTFSLDQCQSIVALMDATELKVNGRLDREEFARLRSRLVHCQECRQRQHVFQNIQRSPGGLLSSDLWKVIENTDFLSGVFISNELLSLMTLRYSNSSGRVSFPSLVCFLIRLETMAKAFRNLSKDGKGIYLTEMERMDEPGHVQLRGDSSRALWTS
ncbi:Calpain-13 [Apodemus speciosus]|uniref:Calpain-13 n=1 Tax=Apodemus speciosus TaxID=105296 RepID=A0ABQ0FQG8_APOSI